MSVEEGFKRKSTRMAAIEAAKKIKKNAEENVHKYPLYRDELVTPSDDVVTSDTDNNTPGQRGHKGMIEDQVFDSKEIVQDSSKNISKRLDSSKSDKMPKKRRGRPPKLESAKCTSSRSRNAKYKNPKCEEADYDVNLRRESYNTFLPYNEPLIPTIFSGPKQLQIGNGGISYSESLMKFTKDLGPTAQKVARRMLQRQYLTNPPQHQLEPLFPSPDVLRLPHELDVNSINGSVSNTSRNQLTQPLTSFGDSIKGKKIMVDDGKSNCNKWDAGVNLDFLFSKQKGGVRIGNSSLDNQDLVNNNLDHAQVGNQRAINQTGSFSSTYKQNLNQNINKISRIEDISAQKEVFWTPSNQKQISSVYTSTYLSHPRNVSSSYLGFDSEVCPISWGPQPPMHSPTPVQPPQNWCMLPHASTYNKLVASDNILKEKELHLALALSMQVKDQEDIWSRNLGEPSANQFLQVHPHGPDQQQPQDPLLMPMPPPFWSESEMLMLGANPEHDPLPFVTQQNSGSQIGNKFLLHPPPGF